MSSVQLQPAASSSARLTASPWSRTGGASTAASTTSGAKSVFTTGTSFMRDPRSGKE